MVLHDGAAVKELIEGTIVTDPSRCLIGVSWACSQMKRRKKVESDDRLRSIAPHTSPTPTPQSQPCLSLRKHARLCVAPLIVEEEVKFDLNHFCVPNLSCDAPPRPHHRQDRAPRTRSLP